MRVRGDGDVLGVPSPRLRINVCRHADLPGTQCRHARLLRHLTGIVSEVLDLSRFDLERKQIALKVDVAGDLPPVMADRLQIDQMLLNLLHNATEAITAAENRKRQTMLHVRRDSPATVLFAVRYQARWSTRVSRMTRLSRCGQPTPMV